MVESDQESEAKNDLNSHMILAMENDGTSDPLLDSGLCAIECEHCEDLSIAEIQAESHQPQTWSSKCQASHIEDAG